MPGQNKKRASKKQVKAKKPKTPKAEQPKQETPENNEELQFEDPFEDEFEQEDVVQEDERLEGRPDEGESAPHGSEIWREDVHGPLKEDEELEFDSSAYDMLHALSAEWSCLSFDFIRDRLGQRRKKFPHTAFLATGTQAGFGQNKVIVMKLDELQKTKRDNDDSDASLSDDDDEAESDPVVEFYSYNHAGGVNRIRSMPQQSSIVATWSEDGNVYIYDVAPALETLNGHPTPLGNGVACTLGGHTTEGFALAWSNITAGRLLTGDCDKNIILWDPVHFDARQHTVAMKRDGGYFVGHQSSVEDLQWSPTEENVFASCSSDQTVRIWDARRKNGSALGITAHNSDVNVISWNPHVTYLMVSGSDDGSFRIWDLRRFQPDGFVAQYNWHTKPITSIEWSPHDESSLAVSCADNSVTLWDFSVEEDAEGVPVQTNITLPPQLMFVHQGQVDVKEAHWHPQIPGVCGTTALDGFNIFKPSNIGATEEIAEPDGRNMEDAY